ncbi:MAG: glycerol dehydrogenase [Cellulomonadaceae bacterium]|nr:glycerol dehydrogenase [Cellulomonadaceae bacterium]
MTVPVTTTIFPGRYLQGRNAMTRLGEFTKLLGATPLIVADDAVWGFVADVVTASLKDVDLPVVREGFCGLATAKEVDRLTQVIKDTNSDIVLAVGGGNTIDAVKAAGHLAGVRWASIPTVASTDAPTSALSVIYTEDGAFEEYRFFPKNPDLVLVDTQICANAPLEFLVGGIGDALATWLEARATRRAAAATMAGGLPTHTGTALAELSWNLIHENAIAAIEAVKENLVTPAVEALVEANTLLSGVGFESGGLAAAHAIHNGLTFAPQTHGLTHGQKVNIGSVTQLVLEHAPMKDIEDFVIFTTRVGLPNTLTEVGLKTTDEKELRGIADTATVAGETIHNMPFPVTAEDVYLALKSIEGLSRRIRSEAGLPEPEFYTAH